MKLIPAKCPSCGANIEVDRSLKFTKCDYCNTKIVVEEAIENLLKVELKDSPTLDNYIKLGSRYFDNKEFEEAYKAYAKAEEINPDNPIVVLRKGLSKSMLSEYNNFDVSSAINGMKTSYDLMKKMKFSKTEINQSIYETSQVIEGSMKYVVEVYNRNKLNIEQTKGYIERLESCLNGFIYLDSIVMNDSKLEHTIIESIIDIINTILGNANKAKYNLSTEYVNELKAKKKNYEQRIGTNNKTAVNIKKEKVVEVETRSSKVKDILCYLMIALLSFMLLGSILNKESFLEIFLWLLSIISFIPMIKKQLVKKYGSNIGKIIIFIRIILVISAIIVLGSGPSEFENKYNGEDGNTITIKDGKFEMTKEGKTIDGSYHWDSKDNDYYIHVQTTNNEDYEYRYRSSTEGGTLCLLEENQCTKIYTPIN